METILPEGKTQVTVSGKLSDRINNVQFTNQGIEVWLTKVVDDDKEQETYDLLNALKDRLIEKYAKQLSDELTTTRNDAIDELRVELDAQYKEKMDKAREMILAMREEIKLLKGK
jgi:DNA gyrase/topoisomerase IV subunit B